MTRQDRYDVIICGAGPCGLGAAIFLARTGLTVQVLEQADRPGPHPRGETARPHPVFAELLGPGFMESISTHRSAGRRFHSPRNRKQFAIERPQSSYLFPWELFITRLYEQARQAGAGFSFNTTVSAPLVNDDICHGVRTEDGEELHARTVLDCTGHSSLLGRTAGIDYAQINAPMVKCLASDFHAGDGSMEFFFLPGGAIESAPDFPPCIAFVFPHGDDRCETGLLFIPGAARRLGLTLPEEETTLRVWRELKSSGPGLAELLQGTTVDYEAVTMLPMAGMHPDGMIIPGLAHLGDSIGFVESSGGSGIVSSLENARNTAAFLARYRATPWNEHLRGLYNRDFASSEIYRHIRKVYRTVLPGLGLLFASLKTPARINRFWWLIRLFYRL